jgi:succinate dehydrogenase/fumarate reductase flavoprotein subunit
MASKDDKEKTKADKAAKPVNRRSFLKGTAAGLGGAAIAGLGTGQAEGAQRTGNIKWDQTYDVVVLGSGAAGMPAAIAARDGGASVVVVEKNWDVGGRAILSGASIQLGCGHRLQVEAGVHDTPDQFFLDWTGSRGQAPEGIDPKRWGNDGWNPLAKTNDRDIIRAFADNAVDSFNFLEANGVKWRGLGGIRGPGSPNVPRQANAAPWPDKSGWIISPRPGSGMGSGLIRPLQKSAEAKGVKILLLHRMRVIHREQPTSGRVIGITAEIVDKWNKPTGKTVNIRARKGIIIATGGPSANYDIRRIYDPRLTEEYSHWGAQYSTKDADGELAGMAINASLWTACNQINLGDRQVDRPGGALGTEFTIGGRLIDLDSPMFFKQGTQGLSMSDWQNGIMVQENGLRFDEETLRGKPLGSPGWRKHIDAALQWNGSTKRLNGGGPIWGIFDSAAVEREKWKLEMPYVDKNGGFFFEADTIESLAPKLVANKYSSRPMPPEALRATVDRYNSFVDSGKDTDYGKPTPMYKIEKPPFYAAWATPPLHDVFAGLRINKDAQVIDVHGQVIPGLYAAGESASGISQHGLAKGIIFGRLAGIHAAKQQAS